MTPAELDSIEAWLDGDVGDELYGYALVRHRENVSAVCEALRAAWVKQDRLVARVEGLEAVVEELADFVEHDNREHLATVIAMAPFPDCWPPPVPEMVQRARKLLQR